MIFKCPVWTNNKGFYISRKSYNATDIGKLLLVALGITLYVSISFYKFYHFADKVPVVNKVKSYVVGKLQTTVARMMSPPTPVAGSPSARMTTALFRFGVITDLQYADVENGENYPKTRIRYYRQSLVHLRNAIKDWKESPGIEFAFHLGDLIDGRSKRNKKAQVDLQTMLQTFKTLEKPVYYLWGNHEFYNMNRKDLVKIEGFNSSLHPSVNQGKTLFKDYEDQTYFEWSPCAQYRLVAIDCYDITTLGLDQDDPRYKEAQELLLRNNPNKDLNSPNNMVGVNRRFVQYNGGVGKKQLQWLEHTLSQADRNKEHVIVLGQSKLPSFQSIVLNICLF